MHVDVEGAVLDGGCDTASPDGRGVLGKDGEFGEWDDVAVVGLRGG